MMIIILIIALVLGLLLLAVIGKSGPKTTGKNRTKSIDREFVALRWSEIEGMTGGSLRSAVSEADKLLDYALRHSGATGATMGERLKSSGSRFSDIDAIWSAHKVRNALAHEAEFDLVPAQAKEAVASFKQGLRDLGAL